MTIEETSHGKGFWFWLAIWKLSWPLGSLGSALFFIVLFLGSLMFWLASCSRLGRAFASLAGVACILLVGWLAGWLNSWDIGQDQQAASERGKFCGPQSTKEIANRWMKRLQWFQLVCRDRFNWWLLLDYKDYQPIWRFDISAANASEKHDSFQTRLDTHNKSLFAC